MYTPYTQVYKIIIPTVALNLFKISSKFKAKGYKYLGGEVKLGESIEKERMLEDKENFYEPLWIDLNELQNLLVYPREIRDWLISDISSNFIDAPRSVKLETKDLRTK